MCSKGEFEWHGAALMRAMYEFKTALFVAFRSVASRPQGLMHQPFNPRLHSRAQILSLTGPAKPNVREYKCRHISALASGLWSSSPVILDSMARLVSWPQEIFFYAIGNTPAACLTSELPPEQSADVLLLGCGDVRNILYTTYADIGARE